MVFQAPRFLTVVGVDVLDADHLRHVLYDLDQLVELVHLDQVDELLLEVFQQLAVDVAAQLRVSVRELLELGRQAVDQALGSDVLDWDFDCSVH